MNNHMRLTTAKKRGRPEADLAALIVQYLELDGWRAIKMEPLSHPLYGKGSGEPGMPDYLFLRYRRSMPSIAGWLRSDAEVFWVEFKTRRGTIQQNQIDWHARERARGALVVCAKADFVPTLEGFAAWYEASGLARRSLTVGGGR